jgi:hypothetical protein
MTRVVSTSLVSKLYCTFALCLSIIGKIEMLLAPSCSTYLMSYFRQGVMKR